MQVKIVSFNIRCCDDKDGHSIAERAPRLAAALSPIDADLIGLQEYRPAWEEHIAKYFGENYEIFNVYRDSQKPESTPILWKKDKFTLVDKGCFWLSDTPLEMSGGWDSIGCKRICEYAILEEKESGERITFMNTHFGFSDDCQIKSAKLIYEFSKKISNFPTFVTGDFNMTPESLGYAEMTRHFTDTNSVTAKNPSPTYHGYAPEKHPDSLIDFCFVSESVKPLSYKVIDDTFDGKYPSDHYGLVIDLEI